MVRVSVAAVGVVGAVAIAAFVFVASGVYNIGADDHHTKIVLLLIEQLRERSIAVRAGGVEVPNLEDPGKILAGADLYTTRCVACHLAPGMFKSDIRPGLYPLPPNLAMAVPPDAQRAFWIIEHGIKMSGMPAWGKTLSDAQIWELVAFLRKMPTLSQETYQQLSQNGPE